MKKLWIHREIDAPADNLWNLICDLYRWPDWGPTVAHAELRSDRLDRIATQEEATS